jgi:hypothetical protein
MAALTAAGLAGLFTLSAAVAMLQGGRLRIDFNSLSEGWVEVLAGIGLTLYMVRAAAIELRG